MMASSLRTFLRGVSCVSPRITISISSSKRSLSSLEGLERFQDPSKYVSGVTREKLEADPDLQAFFLANFPEEIKEENDEKEEEEILDPIEEARAALNIRTLHCYKRDTISEEGTRRCYRLRDDENFIPGLLYGDDPFQNIKASEPSSKMFVKTHWSVIQRELVLYHLAFSGRVYDLTVYEDQEDTVGTVHRVLPRDIKYHPVVNKIYCLNFLRYHVKRPVKIPLKYINEEDSNALKRGAFMVPISRNIECMVEEGQPIPDFIPVDCSGLKLKQTVRLDRLIFPDGVKPSKNVDKEQFLVGSIFGRRSQVGSD